MIVAKPHRQTILIPVSQRIGRSLESSGARCPSTRLAFASLVVVLGVLGSVMPAAMAQSDVRVTDSLVDPTVTSSLGSAKVVVGITGHYRVGYWTAVRLDAAPATDAAGDKLPRISTVMETTDGDGVRVRYEQTLSPENDDCGYVIPGSEAAPLIIRIASEAKPRTVFSGRFPMLDSPSRGASMVPRHMPWIVVIGDPLGMDRIGANELLRRDPTVAVSLPTQASDLPDSALGYDGVDLIVISGSGLDLLRQLRDPQRGAISQWLADGGRVLLSLGASTDSFRKDAAWIIDWLPVDASELSTVTIDPSAIETFTSTRVPLQPFAGARLPRDRGHVLISGRTMRRITTPIASRYGIGFGELTVIAADLDRAPFVDWPDRVGLITQLTGKLLVKNEQLPFRTSRATAFDDLAGQARATLDQFDVKRQLSFSLISLLLLSLVALIGPLDYWLINRVLGKPLLGWMTFPLMVIALSALLVYQSRATVISDAATSAPLTATSDVSAQPGAGPSTEPRDAENAAWYAANRLEMIDLDGIRQRGRAFAWEVVYSHPASRFDLRVSPSSVFEQIITDAASVLTHPFGYPGLAFGGIEIAGEDLRMPPYRVVMTADGFDGERQRSFDSFIAEMPLAPRSSKSLATRARFPYQPIDLPGMNRRPGSDLLAGELVNPLPVDLLDGMLIYRNWVYLLPTRFPSGASIPAVDSLRQKNFRWQLSRKKALESSSEGEAWNAADFGSISRVAEMLMFHSAVGGSRYTQLHHDPLSSLDLSHVLTDDRCVLVGRVADPLTLSQLSTQAADQVATANDTLTMIRLILPVHATKIF